MDKIFERPWLLRTVALLLAILFFFSVRSFENTTNQTNSTSSSANEMIIRDIPIEIKYDDENFVVTGVPQTVDVTVKGPMALTVSAQANRDFTVYLDLKDKTIGKHKVAYHVSGLSDKLTATVKPKTETISIEERISQQVKVEHEMNLTQIDKGHYVKNVEITPETVMISGAKSVVESISFVKANIPVENHADKTFETTANVKIFDREYNALNVDVEPKSVDVKVEIGEYNRNVPIVLKQKGKTKDGVKIASISSNSENITLYGPKDIIDQIGQLQVDVDISNVKKSDTLSVKLKKPDGVTSMSADSIKVKVAIEKDTEAEEDKDDDEVTEAEEDLEIASAEQTSKVFENVNITMPNLNTDLFTQQFANPISGQVDVTVTGDKEALEKLTENDLKAVVEADDVTEGTLELPVELSAPEGMHVTASVQTATIKFTKTN